MKLILIWQSDKDFTQTIISISDKNLNQTFRKSERQAKIIYTIFSIFVILVYIESVVYGFNKLYGYYIKLILVLVLFIGYIYSYKSLTCLIQKYHVDRYLKIKRSLRVFIIAEMIPLVISISFNLSNIIKRVEDPSGFI